MLNSYNFNWFKVRIHFSVVQKQLCKNYVKVIVFFLQNSRYKISLFRYKLLLTADAVFIYKLR